MPADRHKHMCGACKKTFTTLLGVRNHIKDSHKDRLTGVYMRIEKIDLREPSFADRAIEARLDIAMGLPTNDAWLLGDDDWPEEPQS